ncbi:protein CASC3 isoform X3 [Monomorium pharaonis]|uniref:protein CASC3 isoform X3 n=1 Tax=Monomorium pharaonis TaxID=307658 RepID=UPI00063F22B2|nr:protein CASC3 isoform X3 [Monomorium pharaonis]
MSDTRRRRKSNQSCGSDDLSDSYEELNATKETQSSEQTDGHQDSECDIYESDSDAESQEGGEQRESGDGQEEEKPPKKLDDDEDRRNPQYIPKRGTFYEHDDRTTDEVTDNNTEQQANVKETKEKKVWKDKEDRWDHDRYNDEEQAPKRPEELIATYGYDIRNEEGPPRARRRRRYGRGPNKYTRNWEDEDAYGKTIPGRGNNRRFHKNNEDFPALGNSKQSTPSKVEEPVISSAWYSSKNKTQNKTQNFPPLQAQQDNAKTKPVTTSNTSTNENKLLDESNNTSWKKDGRHVTQNQSTNGNTGSGGEADKLANAKPSPRENNKRNTQESVSLAASRTRGRGFKPNPNNNMVTNRIVENKSKGRGPGPVTVENRRNNTTQHNEEHQLAHDMKQQLNINDGSQYHQPARHNSFFTAPNQHRSNTVPPRMQQQQQQQQQQSHQQQTHSSQQTIQQQQQDSSGNRPKRYSSLRQRPTISETSAQQNYPSQHAQHGYFPPQAGNSRAVLESQGYPQSHFEQSSPVAPTAAPLAGQPVISLPPGGQANYAPPPFLVPPPQFIPPQTAPPSIINYVPGPNGPTFPPNFQGYQGYNPSVQPQGPPPPQELFQPQGCTYYSPAQQQQQQQQTAPLRRPKAAIPILPPPDNQQSRGRGRTTQQYQQNNQSGGGNIQQIEQEVKSSNMVESDEKPVPGQFDSAQVEHPSPIPSIQESQKNQAPDVVRTVNDVDEKIESITNVDTPMKIDASPIKKDNLDDSVSVKELLEATSNEKNTVSHSPTTLASVETELGNIESTISENTIVEEAAA